LKEFLKMIFKTHGINIRQNDKKSFTENFKNIFRKLKNNKNFNDRKRALSSNITSEAHKHVWVYEVKHTYFVYTKVTRPL